MQVHSEDLFLRKLFADLAQSSKRRDRWSSYKIITVERFRNSLFGTAVSEEGQNSGHARI